MKKIYITSLLTLLSYFCCFSQEVRNEKNQKINIMDGEQKGTLEIFADPMKFDCECENVISVVVRKSSKPNVYVSDDRTVKLEIKGNKYLVTVTNKTDCCFVKPGVYTK